MTILFKNTVKAQVTQSLVKALFERAGYRVTRLGVEELFTEIVHLDEVQYKALGLPLGLRYLPDLLVADHELNKAFLLEVKFRRDFTVSTMEALYKELVRQRKHWAESYTILVVPNAGGFHQDCIRVLGPDKLDHLNPKGKIFTELGDCESLWGVLPTLNDSFSKFSYSGARLENGRYADSITSLIRDLGKL